MSAIFDWFFEDTFNKLERSGLQARQKRRDVIDHLNVMITGLIGGQDLLPEEASREAVLGAVRYHRRMKNENSTICLMGKYHNVLYIAMKTCWNWGVKDSATVSMLLEEIYSCEKTFERLFLGALFGTNAPHFIAGWRSDFKDQDENCRAMVYFLEHAAVARLSFPVLIDSYAVKRLRFIDIPIESCGKASPMRVALQANAPDILLILLRYGANPSPDDGGMPPIFAILDKLLEYENRRYPFQLVTCLQLLMRTIPFVELPFKPLLFHARREMFLEKYFTLLEAKLFKVNRVFGVAELKHLCRCSVREILRKNNQLPKGIATLRMIPIPLRRYIDLMEGDNGEDGATDLNST